MWRQRTIGLFCFPPRACLTGKLPSLRQCSRWAGRNCLIMHRCFRPTVLNWKCTLTTLLSFTSPIMFALVYIASDLPLVCQQSLCTRFHKQFLFGIKHMSIQVTDPPSYQQGHGITQGAVLLYYMAFTDAELQQGTDTARGLVSDQSRCVCMSLAIACNGCGVAGTWSLCVLPRQLAGILNVNG